MILESMKNKSLYILLMALLFMSPSYSTENYFNFETQNIEIKEDGNLHCLDAKINID